MATAQRYVDSASTENRTAAPQDPLCDLIAQTPRPWRRVRAAS
jgi:hypothetical protein